MATSPDQAGPDDVTELLLQARSGERTVFDRLLPLIYDELRRLAEHQLRRERRGHTILATDLAHEAYLKLVGRVRIEWQGRAHFFAVAARAMRRVLVEHARRRSTDKRGGDWRRTTLGDAAERGGGRGEAGGALCADGLGGLMPVSRAIL